MPHFFCLNDTEYFKKKVFCVTAFNQPYNSPLQICIAGRMHFSKKKSQRHVLFKLEQKKLSLNRVFSQVGQ